MSDEKEISINVEIENEPIMEQTSNKSVGYSAIFAGEELARKASEAKNTVVTEEITVDDSEDFGEVVEDISDSIRRLALRKGANIASRINAEANKTTVVTEIRETKVVKKEKVKTAKTIGDYLKLGCLAYIIILIIGIVMMIVMLSLYFNLKSGDSNTIGAFTSISDKEIIQINEGKNGYRHDTTGNFISIS